MRRRNPSALTEEEIAELCAEAARQGISLETLLARMARQEAGYGGVRGGRPAVERFGRTWTDADAEAFTRAVCCVEELGGEETWH